MGSNSQLFRLDGDSLDLNDLCDLFQTGTTKVVKIDDRFYLEMEFPDAVEDARALELAEVELRTVTGIALLHCNFRRVSVGGISKRNSATGKIQTTINASFTVNARSSFGVTFEQENIPTVSKGDAIRQFAASNDALRRALLLYGALDHDWRELYMVLEAIAEGNGGLHALMKKPWAEAAKIDKFKAAVNSYQALGLNARHGSSKNGVQSAQITLSATKDLLRNLLNGWIAELGEGR